MVPLTPVCRPPHDLPLGPRGWLLKPWPNGPPNSSQFEPSSQLRWTWVSFGHPPGLGRIFAHLDPSFPPFGHLGQLKPSWFVIVRWLTRSYSDNWMVSCQLTRLGSSVWPPADASFDFVTWLELEGPFGQGFSGPVWVLAELGLPKEWCRTSGH